MSISGHVYNPNFPHPHVSKRAQITAGVSELFGCLDMWMTKNLILVGVPKIW
jgi:hypothetical protein